MRMQKRGSVHPRSCFRFARKGMGARKDGKLRGKWREVHTSPLCTPAPDCVGMGRGATPTFCLAPVYAQHPPLPKRACELGAVQKWHAHPHPPFCTHKEQANGRPRENTKGLPTLSPPSTSRAQRATGESWPRKLESGMAPSTPPFVSPRPRFRAKGARDMQTGAVRKPPSSAPTVSHRGDAQTGGGGGGEGCVILTLLRTAPVCTQWEHTNGGRVQTRKWRPSGLAQGRHANRGAVQEWEGGPTPPSHLCARVTHKWGGAAFAPGAPVYAR
ncbi:hypothetical protein BJY52DRAFT_1229907 [Lactarius psammicola]|nr:hypothetical protein BJY52DRAFT_1229907 [Lactarius psammicola]